VESEHSIGIPKKDLQNLEPLAFRVLYHVQLALLVSFGVVIDAFAAVAIWTAAGVFPFPYASYVSATLATFLYVSSYLLMSQIGRLTKSVSAVLHLFSILSSASLCDTHHVY
jgi:hypothetical protein